MSRSRVIVITGASSGIGRETALRFARAGETLVLASRRADALRDLAEECERRGGTVLAVQTDVTVDTDVQRLADTTVATFGRIDVWVNNASVSVLGAFDEVPLDDFRRIIDVNLMGYVHGARSAMRVFRAQESGTLVNVSSIIGELPVPYMLSYSMAKAAVNALSMSLRQELMLRGPRGVRVTTVMPASIDTPFYRSSANYSGHVALPPPPVYPASIVAKAIDTASRHPRRQIVAGPTGSVFVRLHRVLPGLVEAQMAWLVHATRSAGGSQPPTTGSIAHPAATDDATIGGGFHGRRKYATRRLLFWGALIGGAAAIASRRSRS